MCMWASACLCGHAYAQCVFVFACMGCGFVCSGKLLLQVITRSSNKNFILKYFRCRDGKRTETRIGMEDICITHFCIPLYTVYMQHIMAHSGAMPFG